MTRYHTHRFFLLLLLLAFSNRICHASPQFLSRTGPHLTDNGKSIRLIGATLYPTWDGKHYLGGSAFCSSDPGTIHALDRYISTWIDNAHEAHLNCLRIGDYIDNLQDDDNPICYRHIDRLMALAQKKEIFVILDLSTFRNALKAGGKDPYDPANWTQFIQFITHRYKNNTDIAMYSIAGEVPAPHYSTKNPTATQLLDFFSQVSTQIAADDPNHLISSGGFIFMDDPNSGIPWQQIFSLPHIDLATIHAYGENNTVPFKAYQNVGPWAKSRQIPFLVEEFGFQQSVGDQQRAALYRQQYQQGNKYGASEMVFWNLGPETLQNDGSKTTYDVGPETPLTWNAVKAGARNQ